MNPIYARLMVCACVIAMLVFGLCIDKIADRAKARRKAERERMLAALKPSQRTWANNYGRDLV